MKQKYISKLFLNFQIKEMGALASIEVNKIAPDFESKDFKGETFKLSDFKGKKNILVVLNRGFV